MNFDRTLFVAMTVLVGLMFVATVTYNFYARPICRAALESSSMAEPAPSAAPAVAAEPAE